MDGRRSLAFCCHSLTVSEPRLFLLLFSCVSVLMAAVPHRTAVAVQTSLPRAVLVMKRTARWASDATD